MTTFEESQILGRKIRKGSMTELTIPTFTLACEAIKAEKVEEALELVEHGKSESLLTDSLLVMMVSIILEYLAGNFGEEQVEKVFRRRTEVTLPQLIKTANTAEEALTRVTELQRGHGANMSIKEEADRYILNLDPCGSLGRLWRTADVGTTKKAYPWSWGSAGIPYYCVHCCLQSEIMPIEVRGYPIGIHEPPRSPQEPCVRYYYKRPELIPEKYFRRVGMRKTIK